MLLISAAMYAILIFFGVRLGFYLAPIAVAEGRISIARNWQLTSGNFWRIFAVALAVFLPFLLLNILVTGVLFGALSTISSSAGSGADAEAGAVTD